MRHCLCFGRIMKVVRLRNEEKDDQIPNSPPLAITAVKSLVNRNETLERASDFQVSKDVHAQNNAIIFSYRELATATNNFREESLVGEGGFGPVHKGQLERTGQIVAVKQLNHSGLQGDKEFLVEVLMLSLLRHPNLVNLIGYCSEGDQRLLVYEYLPLGSLEAHLHDLRPDMSPLDWDTRMIIAAGAANGLNYLHNQADPPVIYRDLKSSNILLGEGFCPRLSDFGLAKFGPDGDKSHVSTRVMGTYGYCAPEYAGTGKLTMKSDIYSFGVVLLELISGQRALDMSRGHGKHMLVDWARPMLRERKTFVNLADPHLKGQFSEHVFQKAVEVAVMCLRDDPHSRPGMSDVVHALNYLASLHDHDPDADKGEGQTECDMDKLCECKDNSKGKKMSMGNADRELAVAEAKIWGKTCREKRIQNDADDLNR